MHEPQIVRLATSKDAAAILKLCWLAQEERNERAPSGAKAETMIRSCLDGKGVIGVIDEDLDGHLRGMIGLVISSAWCSEDKELYDWLVYVRPDCRRLRCLTPLLEFAREQSVKMQMPLWMGWIGDERSEAKARTYQRLFPKYGEFYRFDPR